MITYKHIYRYVYTQFSIDTHVYVYCSVSSEGLAAQRAWLRGPGISVVMSTPSAQIVLSKPFDNKGTGVP